jgi:hypothetical protein
MPSTYTPELRLTLQNDGENPSTWGDIANTVFQLIEEAVSGLQSIPLSSGTTTLTTNNGATDQARAAILEFTGALGGANTVVIPNVSKSYLAFNNTSNTFPVQIQTSAPNTASFTASIAGNVLTVTAVGSGTLAVGQVITGASVPAGTYISALGTGSGLTGTYILNNATTIASEAMTATSAIVVPQGTSLLLFCDGNNNVLQVSANAVSLGGISAGNYAQLTQGVANAFLSQNAFTPYAMTFAASQIVNLNSGNVQSLAITGSTTFGTPTGTATANGQPIWMFLTQNATGGYTVGFNSSWLFPNGITPTVDPTPNSTTIVFGMYLASLGKVIVLAVLTGYNGAVVAGNVTVSQNTQNLNLFQLVGSPAAAVNVTLTINPGVRVIATDPQAYAVDLTGFTTGSVITLINNGYILGRGGNGGRGGESGGGGASTTQISAGARGRPGGGAINGPGSGVTVNITNAGFIWGGGGGGGGGGTATGSGTWTSNGGGGGGGSGGSLGGDGGLSDAGDGAISTHNGGDGTWIASGANGAGGAGGGSTAGLAGGNGGDWGTAGSAGTNGAQSQGGAGGAAGPAINPNSGSINFVSGGSSPNVKGST